MSVGTLCKVYLMLLLGYAIGAVAAKWSRAV